MDAPAPTRAGRVVVMHDDVTLWTFVRRLLLGMAPQWWRDMLYGRALRKRIERATGKTLEQYFLEHWQEQSGDGGSDAV